jgi:hypothetical protein
MLLDMEPSARQARIFFAIVGLLFAVLGIVLWVVPAPAMAYGAPICGGIGVGLIVFALLAPKRLVAWIGELVALLP